MCIRSTGECVVIMSCNLDGFVPFDGFVAVSDLFHCSFQEIVRILNVTICSGISRAGLDVCKC